MLITDAQVHLWEVERPDRPWPVGYPITPHRPAGFSAEEMLVEMDAAGVDRAVIVPPSWVGETSATALEYAQAYPKRLAVMGRFNLKAPDAAERLETWLNQPGMLGVRLTFHDSPWLDWLEDGSIDWFFAACQRLRIPLMVYLPGMAEKFIPLAERYPELTLVADHMARVLEYRDDQAFADLDVLLGLAKYPRFFVKVSSVPAYSTEPYPYRNLHGYLRRIYDAFGPRKLFWGSDITRLPGTYRECLDLFRKELDFLGAEDKEWILGRAIAEALNWPEK